MNPISDFQTRLKESIGDISVTELASMLGISKQSASAYLNGTRKPKRLAVAEIARILNVNEAWLMGYDVTKDREFGEMKRSGIRIPVYGNVAAGIPIEAITDIEDYEEIDEETARNGEYIALKIKGDSMEPRMKTGDVVIVRLQPTIEDGEIAVVRVNGDNATCKKIKKTPNGLFLISTNPAYEPMFFSPREVDELPVVIIGKVVELRAKF